MSYSTKIIIIKKDTCKAHSDNDKNHLTVKAQNNALHTIDNTGDTTWETLALDVFLNKSLRSDQSYPGKI